MVSDFTKQEWALVLGGSSGFGLATAKKLAAHGMSVCVVHRDLRGALPRVETEFAEVRAHGHGFLALNLNALESAGHERTLSLLTDALGPEGRVKCLVHSIALGNLKPLAPRDSSPVLRDEDISQTIYFMGSNLLTWVQSLHERRLFAGDTRVLCLTSEGSRVAWRGYAAVSAAKATLEALTRSIAVEFAPFGIRCNAIQAGVTDTPALRRIPDSDRMKELAAQRNPFGRLTHPEDVANFIYLMVRPEAAWVNGAVLRVDGGEAIASL